jgi:3-oxoacyl-[acyl-carrier-protein] synthase II
VVPEPSRQSLQVDRKAQRTMEKQAHLALYGSHLTLRHGRPPEATTNCGLYLGLPMVDEELLPWDVIEPLRTRPAPAELAEIVITRMLPFSGLSKLNSSICAHIATSHGLTGSLAAFSPFADAGLQALIEGALSVQEGENQCALIGAISPKVNAELLVQYERIAGACPMPGEGVAFMQARRAKPAASAGAIEFAGYGRSFAITEARRVEAYVAAVTRALQMASVAPCDVDWVLEDAAWIPANVRAQERGLEQVFARPYAEIPRFNCAAATGILGPAHPLMHAVLAMHGLMSQRRITRGPSCWQEQPHTMRNALVTAGGPQGQFAAVVLSKR